jgi:hypothetical protein
MRLPLVRRVRRPGADATVQRNRGAVEWLPPAWEVSIDSGETPFPAGFCNRRVADRGGIGLLCATGRRFLSRMFRISIEEVGSTGGGSGAVEFVLDDGESRTARQLIGEAVAREIGLRGLAATPAKVAARQKEAIDGFARGTFAMLAGGVPVEDLDQRIPAGDGIQFIRVLPMVGG